MGSAGSSSRCPRAPRALPRDTAPRPAPCHCGTGFGSQCTRAAFFNVNQRSVAIQAALCAGPPALGGLHDWGAAAAPLLPSPRGARCRGSPLSPFRIGKVGNQKRVVGVLLGSWQKKILDVSNSFAGEFGCPTILEPTQLLNQVHHVLFSYATLTGHRFSPPKSGLYQTKKC